MGNVIKLRRGLDIKLAGGAEKRLFAPSKSGRYALQPADFPGVTPRVVVKEGDTVRAGDALFQNKACPEVKFASPVGGTVTAIMRGERRKVLYVEVTADGKQEAADFGKKDVSALDGHAVVSAMLEAGLFGFITQLPYAVSANPQTQPKAIFVSALRDKPLAADFSMSLRDRSRASRRDSRLCRK